MEYQACWILIYRVMTWAQLANHRVYAVVQFALSQCWRLFKSLPSRSAVPRFSLTPAPHFWLRGPKWHMAPYFIDELQPSSLTLCCHLTSHVLQHSYPQSAALEEMKNTTQSKWFTLGLTQHIDPSKLLLTASPEGHSVLYYTAISEATGLLLCYRFN